MTRDDRNAAMTKENSRTSTADGKAAVETAERTDSYASALDAKPRCHRRKPQRQQMQELQRRHEATKSCIQSLANGSPPDDDTDDDTDDDLLKPVFVLTPAKNTNGNSRKRRSSATFRTPGAKRRQPTASSAHPPSIGPSNGRELRPPPSCGVSSSRRRRRPPSTRDSKIAPNLDKDSTHRTLPEPNRVNASTPVVGRTTATMGVSCEPTTPTDSTGDMEQQRKQQAAKRVAGLSLHLVNGVCDVDDLAWFRSKDIRYPVRRNIPRDEVIGLDLGPNVLWGAQTVTSPAAADEVSALQDAPHPGMKERTSANDETIDDTPSLVSSQSTQLTQVTQPTQLSQSSTSVGATNDEDTTRSISSSVPATTRSDRRRLGSSIVRYLGHLYKHAGKYASARETQLEPISVDFDSRMRKYERFLVKSDPSTFSHDISANRTSLNLLIETMAIRTMINKVRQAANKVNSSKNRLVKQSPRLSSLITTSSKPQYETPRRSYRCGTTVESATKSSAKRKRSTVDESDFDNDENTTLCGRQLLEPVVNSQDDEQNDDDSESNGESDSDDSILSPGMGRKTETLRPGDVIQYYDLSRVAGTAHALRTTQILGVRASEEYCLILANGDYLPRSHPICRIYKTHRGRLIDCRSGNAVKAASNAVISSSPSADKTTCNVTEPSNGKEATTDGEKATLGEIDSNSDSMNSSVNAVAQLENHVTCIHTGDRDKLSVLSQLSRKDEQSTRATPLRRSKRTPVRRTALQLSESRCNTERKTAADPTTSCKNAKTSTCAPSRLLLQGLQQRTSKAHSPPVGAAPVFQSIDSFKLRTSGMTDLSAGMAQAISSIRSARNDVLDEAHRSLAQFFNDKLPGKSCSSVGADQDDSSCKHAMWSTYKRLLNKQIKQVRHCQGTQYNFIPHMTVSRLELAIAVCEVTPSPSFGSLVAETGISALDLDMYFHGDPKQTLTQTSMMQIHDALSEWLDRTCSAAAPSTPQNDKLEVSAPTQLGTRMGNERQSIFDPTSSSSSLARPPSASRGRTRRTPRTDPRRPLKRMRRSSIGRAVEDAPDSTDVLGCVVRTPGSVGRRKRAVSGRQSTNRPPPPSLTKRRRLSQHDRGRQQQQLDLQLNGFEAAESLTVAPSSSSSSTTSSRTTRLSSTAHRSIGGTSARNNLQKIQSMIDDLDRQKTATCAAPVRQPPDGLRRSRRLSSAPRPMTAEQLSVAREALIVMQDQKMILEKVIPSIISNADESCNEQSVSHYTLTHFLLGNKKRMLSDTKVEASAQVFRSWLARTRPETGV